MNDTISIAEAAEALGLSRQAVYKKLDNDFKPYLQVVNGKKRLNKAVLEKNSKNGLSTEMTENFTKIVNLLTTQNEQLKAELDIKNKQIEELNARLQESNAALLSAQQTAQAAQALHAGDIKQLAERVVADEEASKKKHWWQRK